MIASGGFYSLNHFFGGLAETAYGMAFTQLQIPLWLIGIWAMATMVLAAIAGWVLLLRPSINGTRSSHTLLDPKIEIITGPSTPYHETDVQSGQVLSTVRIGIKNAGGKTLSNCKVYIEKISPSTNSPGGTTLLLDETGFQLRHDDPQKIVEVAAHWNTHNQFRFSTPLGGSFFDSTQMMDDKTRRIFAIRVRATESERSALFEILADESKKLHLKFLNYIN